MLMFKLSSVFGLFVCLTAVSGLGDTAVFAAQSSDVSGNWRQLLPSVSPSARTGHAMAYDAARQEVALFGGTALIGAIQSSNKLMVSVIH